MGQPRNQEHGAVPWIQVLLSLLLCKQAWLGAVAPSVGCLGRCRSPRNSLYNIPASGEDFLYLPVLANHEGGASAPGGAQPLLRFCLWLDPLPVVSLTVVCLGPDDLAREGWCCVMQPARQEGSQSLDSLGQAHPMGSLGVPVYVLKV